MARKKTLQEYNQQLHDVNPNISLIGEYINGESVTEFRCNRCGRIFTTTPRRALRGVGCQHCDRKRVRRSHQDFVDDIYKINPKIQILNEYKNHQTKVKCKCLIDGHVWESLPLNLLRGHGCPKCSAAKLSQKGKLTHQTFMKKFNRIGNQNLTILSKYNGYYEPILCKCNICGYEWQTNAANLIKANGGTGCPNYRNHPDHLFYNQKSHDQFIREMYDINSNIEIIGDYIGHHIPIKCRCKICGFSWKNTPGNLLSGSSCPHCKKSNGEERISQILEKNNIIYQYQYKFSDCKNIKPLPFDFYLPDYNTCIEYDGEQHFRPVNFGGCSDEEAQVAFIKTREHDAIKNEYCKVNNINLVRISYKELKSAEQILSKIVA